MKIKAREHVVGGGISRGLALLLSFVMAISVIPALKGNVYAHADESKAYAAYDVTTDTNKVKSGDDLEALQVFFNGIPWYIIEDNSTSATSGTITLFAADESFGESKFRSDESSNDYSTSTVKDYLDNVIDGTAGGVLPNFKNVANAIVTNDEVGDKLYLLSIDEAGRIPENVRKMSEDGFWWLRSQGTEGELYAARVRCSNGSISSYGLLVSTLLLVRPALKLDLSSVSFSSVSKKFTVNSARTYDVNIIAGSNMTKTADSGAESQTDVQGLMKAVVYTVDGDFYFPIGYSVEAVNGIIVTRNSYTRITVAGTPTDDVTITLTAPTAKTILPRVYTGVYAEKCTTEDNNDGKIIGVSDSMEYKKSDAGAWTIVGAGCTEITGLVPGIYYVRYSGSGGLIFESLKLTIADNMGSSLNAYNVTITAGSNMTKTKNSGAASQTDVYDRIRDVVYTADEGFYFPVDYSVEAVNGITVTRNSYTQITVSGEPTDDVTITLTAPTAKTKPDAPKGIYGAGCTTEDNNDGELLFLFGDMEYKKSDAGVWTTNAGNINITNLVPGTYYVRFKETDTNFASDSQEVTIAPYIEPSNMYEGNPYAGLIPKENELDDKVVRFNNFDWYIIEDNSTAVDAGTVTLCAANSSFGTSKFDSNGSSNDYSNSTVKAYLDQVIAGTAGDGKPNFANVANVIVTNTLTGSKLYLLSIDEFCKTRVYGRSSGQIYYNSRWLRSPGCSDGTVMVVADGTIYNNFPVGEVAAVIPALKLDLSSVVFSSDTKTFTPLNTVNVSDIDLTYGYTEGSVNVSDTTAKGYTITGYQWYINTTNSNQNGTAITGATSAVYTIPVDKAAGTEEYYYCEVTFTRSDNGETATLTSNVAVVTVGKATSSSVTDVKISTPNNATSISASLTGKMPENAGTLTYTAGAPSITKADGSIVSVEDFVVDSTGIVTATIKDGSIGDVITLPVTISSANYTDANVNVVVTLTEKNDAGVTINDGKDIVTVFGTESFTPTKAVTEPGTGTGVWTWTSSDVDVADINKETGLITIKNAGSATITAVYESDTTFGKTEVNITVQKADITPTVTLDGWTVGETPKTPSVSGNTGNGTVTYSYSDSENGTYTDTVPVTAGTWYVKAVIAETTNYKSGIAVAKFTITGVNNGESTNGTNVNNGTTNGNDGYSSGSSGNSSGTYYGNGGGTNENTSGNGGSSNSTTSGNGAGTTTTGNGTGNKSGSGTSTTTSGSGASAGSGSSTTGSGSGTSTGSGSGTSTGDKGTEETVVTKNADGSETTTTEIKNEDGSTTTNSVTITSVGLITEKTVTTNTDGSTETKEVEKDAKGNTLSTTVETKTVDENKTVTVITKTETAEGTVSTSEVSTTKKGTTTINEQTVDAAGIVTTTVATYKKNGAGTSKTETKDENEKVLSTTTEKTTVNKKNGTSTTTVTTKNADKSSVSSKYVTDKDGNTIITETIKNLDKTKTTVTGEIKADGTGSKTTVTTDKKGNVLSTTKESVKISSKGTVTESSSTVNADGTKEKSKTIIYTSGKVIVTNTFTDADGNKTELKETVKPVKKGSTKVSVTRTETIGSGKDKKSTKVSVNVSISKKGKVKGSITEPDDEGKEQKTKINTTLKELGLEGKGISEVIESLLQNIIIEK